MRLIMPTGSGSRRNGKRSSEISEKKYPTQYLSRVNPWSKSYVRHLHYLGDPHYAQKHPDEDWAETFAIWLDPRSHWETKYRNWPNALEKLSYVDRLMDEIAGKEPLHVRKKREGEYSTIEETVSEWWGINGEILDQELQEYINDMNELFIKPADGHRKLPSRMEDDPKIRQTPYRTGQPLDLRVE